VAETAEWSASNGKPPGEAALLRLDSVALWSPSKHAALNLKTASICAGQKQALLWEQKMEFRSRFEAGIGGAAPQHHRLQPKARCSTPGLAGEKSNSRVSNNRSPPITGLRQTMVVPSWRMYKTAGTIMVSSAGVRPGKNHDRRTGRSIWTMGMEEETLQLPNIKLLTSPLIRVNVKPPHGDSATSQTPVCRIITMRTPISRILRC